MTAKPPNDLRPGETAVDLPAGTDAGLYFIGVIHTPWTARSECPRRGDPEGPLCRIVLDARWIGAAADLDPGATLEVLYWMHRARRDLVRQNPKSRGTLFGTFALRSPMRPNPIAASTVLLTARAGTVLWVRGLDCIDGTPLLDIKPSRCPMWTPA